MTPALLLPFIILLVLALAVIVIPVFRKSKSGVSDATEQRSEQNKNLYQQRLSELEKELENKVLEADEYERVKTELQRSFLADMNDDENVVNKAASLHSTTQGSGLNSVKTLPLLMAALLPIVSIFLYMSWGAGRDLQLPVLMENVREASSAEEQEAALVDLSVVLQSRFERHEDDIRAGYTLGTLYLQLENYPAAGDVFKRLATQVEAPVDKAAILGQLAQTQYLQADQFMTEELSSTIEQALALNPNEQAIMSLLAIEAFLDADVQTALSFWRRQLMQLTPGSADAQILEQRIGRVAELLPDAETTEVDSAQASVLVHVSVSEELQPRLDSSMRVFVFARGTQLPMPLAAQTYSVSELPLTVRLDDSMAMMPSLKLSSAETVFVGARISLSGEAVAQSGDFQSISEPFQLSESENELNLVISEVVP